MLVIEKTQTFTFVCLLPCRPLADAQFPPFLPYTPKAHHLHLPPVLPLLHSALAQSTSQGKKNYFWSSVFYHVRVKQLLRGDTTWERGGEARLLGSNELLIHLDSQLKLRPWHLVLPHSQWRCFPPPQQCSPWYSQPDDALVLNCLQRWQWGWLTQCLTDRLLPAFRGLAPHLWQEGCWMPQPEPEFAGHNTKRAAAAAAPARQTWLRIASAE